MLFFLLTHSTPISHLPIISQSMWYHLKMYFDLWWDIDSLACANALVLLQYMGIGLTICRTTLSLMINFFIYTPSFATIYSALVAKSTLVGCLELIHLPSYHWMWTHTYIVFFLIILVYLKIGVCVTFHHQIRSNIYQKNISSSFHVFKDIFHYFLEFLGST